MDQEHQYDDTENLSDDSVLSTEEDEAARDRQRWIALIPFVFLGLLGITFYALFHYQVI